jgi:hypothetical protein
MFTMEIGVEMNCEGWSEEEIDELVRPIFTSSELASTFPEAIFSVSVQEDGDKYYDVIDEDGNFDPAAHMDNFVVSATSQGTEASIEIQVSSLPKIGYLEEHPVEYQEIITLLDKLRESLREDGAIYYA